MKTNYYCKLKKSSKVFFALALVFVALISSCKKEDLGKADFKLKDNPTSLVAPVEGIAQTYTVVSNGDWKVEPLNKESWLSIDPMEGSGNGTFTINVLQNTTIDDRSEILTFMVNGKRPNISLKIEQEGKNEEDDEEAPFLILDGDPVLNATAFGITEEFTIRSNGSWEIKLPEDAGSSTDEPWVSVEPATGAGDATISITVDKNTDSESRMMNLVFILNGKQQDNTLQINQEKASEDGVIVFTEDFSWLEYGSGIFYETTGEKRMDQWTTEELAKGWTSTPVEGSSNQLLVYARQGFVKLGKTNFGGDFISPKLTAVKGTKNLEVRFKAIPYQTKAGTRDGTILNVSIIGPGTISTTDFNIENWPNYDTDPNATEAWKESEAERAFIITGATAETQIRFLGQDFDLRDATPNKNRIFLDDVIVTVKE